MGGGVSLPVIGVPGLFGGAPFSLIVTSFTQSLGAELLTNGTFAAWTGDNPDGWTVAGEVGADPEVTQRAPTAGHADAVGVGGAANLYSSGVVNAPSLAQNVATAGLWYEDHTIVTKYVSGGVAIKLGGEEVIVGSSGARLLRRAVAQYVGIRNHTAGGAANFTVDSISYKRITLNAQQVGVADHITDFTYALPASPAAGDRIILATRISDANLETGYTCWQPYLQRNTTNNAWDFRLDSVNAGTATNRINVTGVGDVTTIREIAVGSLHDCYTSPDGTTFTKRGAQINVSLNDTSKGVNTIYCSGAVPSQLWIRKP